MQKTFDPFPSQFTLLVIIHLYNLYLTKRCERDHSDNNEKTLYLFLYYERIYNALCFFFRFLFQRRKILRNSESELRKSRPFNGGQDHYVL